MQTTAKRQTVPPSQVPVPTAVTLPRLMSQKDLASYLGKSTAWCERARWAGTGPRFIRLGRHVRYRVDDVLAWVESCESSDR